jgi:L-2-hydroxyglutarate oxidase LhgO
MSGEYDLVIVGGGISGASLLYTTAKFTDVESIALIEKESEIAAIEPNVVEGRDPGTDLLALQTPDGYVVDYGRTTKSFVEQAREESNVDVFTGTEVEDITETTEGYTLTTPEGPFDCEAAVVAAGSHSLQIAKEMGYGQEKVLLPARGVSSSPRTSSTARCTPCR